MTVDKALPERFPGLDVLAQAPHWDTATRSVIHARISDPPPMRFFTREEEATATCLLDRLVGQDRGRDDPVIDLARLIDRRLAEEATDGWHYDTMATDEDAWRSSLAALDEDARACCGAAFHDLDLNRQRELIEAVRTTDGDWHGLDAGHLWSLWTRYATTAFYSHPALWDEIGFSGPAYPRGYKNIGIDRREPFEVRDALPADDPVRRGGDA